MTAQTLQSRYMACCPDSCWRRIYTGHLPLYGLGIIVDRLAYVFVPSNRFKISTESETYCVKTYRGDLLEVCLSSRHRSARRQPTQFSCLLATRRSLQELSRRYVDSPSEQNQFRDIDAHSLAVSRRLSTLGDILFRRSVDKNSFVTDVAWLVLFAPQIEVLQRSFANNDILTSITTRNV